MYAKTDASGKSHIHAWSYLRDKASSSRKLFLRDYNTQKISTDCAYNKHLTFSGNLSVNEMNMVKRAGSGATDLVTTTVKALAHVKKCSQRRQCSFTSCSTGRIPTILY